ncbi:hypothetical protein [Pseudomonas helleri]|uniref:hypothetical protein n=1 Tax=Pseudomonas helleri TaxID=1608996 RepID=UPI00188637B7|nr:hypothetical protein [Pseudomonas helleri]
MTPPRTRALNTGGLQAKPAGQNLYKNLKGIVRQGLEDKAQIVLMAHGRLLVIGKR